MTEPQEDAARMGLVAILMILSFSCLFGSALMWFGSILPSDAVWWVMMTTCAAFASAFVLGTILAITGAKARSGRLLKGDALDKIGDNLAVKRMLGEADSAYRRRIQRSVVSRDEP